jgi:polyisoprenyl-teichoic acid--peptidoglycan teichoic acid transferase
MPGCRRTWLKVLKIGGLTIVALVALAGGVACGWLQATTQTLSTRHPAVVKKVRKQLTPALPGRAVTIAVMGSDDTGHSDTLMLVRLDPRTKSISMLSIPRDLWVHIPGHGMSKINAAYTLGGPALAVRTLRQVLGVKVNHFVDIDFAGLWQVVDVLGGVYVQVDHRYHHAADGDYLAINVRPGYQLLGSGSVLRLMRYRHDQYYDFGRMQRQQLLLRELQRQASRWRDWTKLPKLVARLARCTDSDISSARQLVSLASLILQLDTSRVYQTRIQGSTPTIEGQSVVLDSPAQLKAAVARFRHPSRTPNTATTSAAVRKAVARSTRAKSKTKKATAVNGSILLRNHITFKVAAWRRAAQRTTLNVLMPTVWATGFTYDSAMPFRTYRVDTGGGKVPALVAVCRAPGSVDAKRGAFDIQEIRWAEAPILLNPTRVQTIGDRSYLLYYTNRHLTQVAFVDGDTAYWVTNTIDNALPDWFLLALAASLKPVQ